MGTHSEQELRDAAEFRAGVHAEALERLRKLDPGITEVVDRFPVEDYFEDNWEYPGKWYTYVAVPPAAKGRKNLINTIVRDTLAQRRGKAAPGDDPDGAVVYSDTRYTLGWKNDRPYLRADGTAYLLRCSPYEPCLYITDQDGNQTEVHNAFDPADVLRDFSEGKTVTSITGREYSARDFCKMVAWAAGRRNISMREAEEVFGDRLIKKEPAAAARAPEKPEAPRDGPFSALIAQYPDLALDYCIVAAEPHGVQGAEAHRRALEQACRKLFVPDEDGACRRYDVRKARGTRIAAAALFSSNYPETGLNYRKAFLYPPHGNGYTGKDFVKVNAALFPEGTEHLEAYEWTTDWSDYFDEGHEWWGALCLTVYDRRLDRFAVILASATD